MTTTIVSIGGVTSAGGTTALDTGAVATLVTNSAPTFVVTWSKTLASTIDVGDIAKATDSGSTTYEYLITAISGTQYTLIQKVGGGLNQDPATICAVVDEYGDCSTIASFSFYRAFSTITLFEAMIDDASPIYWGGSDDVVGECHKDSVFTDSRVYFDNKQSLASVKLTVNSDDRHDGTAGSGVIIRPTAGSGHNNGIIDVDIDNFIMEWIEIDLSSLDAQNTNKAVLLRGTNDDNIIRNNIIHDKGGNPGNTGPFAIHVLAAGATSDNLYILNNIIYSFIETSSDSTAAILAVLWQGGLYIYNNTIYKFTSQGSKFAIGIRFGNDTDNVSYIKNNIVAGLSNGPRAYWKNAAGSTANVANNLSDDTTGATYNAEDMAQSLNDSSALIGKTAAQIDFVNTVGGSEDLHLNTVSVCREAGVSLGTTNEVNIDINGVDRAIVAETWDIGAHQASAKGGSVGKAFIMFLDT